MTQLFGIDKEILLGVQDMVGRGGSVRVLCALEDAGLRYLYLHYRDRGWVGYCRFPSARKVSSGTGTLGASSSGTLEKLDALKKQDFDLSPGFNVTAEYRLGELRGWNKAIDAVKELL